MNRIDMENAGLAPQIRSQAESYQGLYVGRVTSQYKDLYRVITEDGELTAEISGKFRFKANRLSDYPAVGDFVMLDRTRDTGGNAMIHRVLDRKSAFIRKAAGEVNEEQIVAANIDTVFICMSLNADFNLRRAERYLAVAWDSGAVPVLVLTKADLCHELAGKLAEIGAITCGADVIVTSGRSEDGHLPLCKYLGCGRTLAFIGSSGVGKSTLINRLTGRDALKIQEIRKDDKGRHTTTRREMIVIPRNGVVIDTPGMRELGMEGADLASAFTDIDVLSQTCRFHDCSHTVEPDCAVQRAIAAGILSEDRLTSYLKLKKEAKYAGLNSREIEAEKIAVMFAKVGGKKQARNLSREKNKNR